jgi:Ca-activated chloride channel family protein
MRTIIVLIVTALAAVPFSVQAAGTLTPIGSGSTPLEIVDHHVDVVLNDGFARVEILQTFSNPNQNPVEGVYAFPVPKEASLSELVITAGEHELHGEVVAREKGEAIYAQERDAGNDAGLGTREGYQRFEFRVATIPPGASTRVRAVYYQPLEIDTGIGRFLYPLEEGGTDEQAASFWTRNEVVSGTFSAHISLRSSWPIDDLRVPGHNDAVITTEADGTTSIDIQRQAAALNQDLVVYYRLRDGLPGRVEMVASRPDLSEPGTFMLTLTPGIDLQPLQSGRDFVFVLDTSGSMSGKIGTLARGVVRAIEQFDPQDRFRIVTFDSSARELTRGWQTADETTVRRWADEMQRLKSGGSTNVYDGLRLALDRLDDDRATSVLLVTDGVTNTGVVDPPAFHALMEKVDVRVFSFLLGNSANWPLMEVICHASGGFYSSVSNADDVLGQVMLARSKVGHEALHDVELKIHGVGVSDLTEASTGKVYRGQQLVVFGRYDQGGAAEITLDARLTGQDRTWRTTFEFPDQSHDFPEIERLWAMRRITGMERLRDAGLMDADEASAGIRDLALAAQLVTDETAMLVLDDATFTRHGIERRNRDRVTREQQAQARRQAAPASTQRVDEQRPMFKRSAPSMGGGAIHPLAAAGAGLLVLVFVWRLRRLGLFS